MDDALREGMGVSSLGVGAFHAWTSMRARRAERDDGEQRQRNRERLVLQSHMIEVSTACTKVAQHLARMLVCTCGGDGRDEHVGSTGGRRTIFTSSLENGRLTTS